MCFRTKKHTIGYFLTVGHFFQMHWICQLYLRLLSRVQLRLCLYLYMPCFNYRIFRVSMTKAMLFKTKTKGQKVPDGVFCRSKPQMCAVFPLKNIKNERDRTLFLSLK